MSQYPISMALLSNTINLDLYMSIEKKKKLNNVNVKFKIEVGY